MKEYKSLKIEKDIYELLRTEAYNKRTTIKSIVTNAVLSYIKKNDSTKDKKKVKDPIKTDKDNIKKSAKTSKKKIKEVESLEEFTYAKFINKFKEIGFDSVEELENIVVEHMDEIKEFRRKENLEGTIDFGAFRTKKSDLEIKADTVGIRGLSVHETNTLIQESISKEVHKF